MRQGRMLGVGKTLIALTALAFGTAQAAPAAATGSCTVNGKTYKNCSPAMQKQAARQAARQKAAPVKKGTAATFAGVSPATATMSPLASTTMLGAGATVATMAAPAAQPDYFGVGNYANSPLPKVQNGATITVGNPLVARAYATDFAVPAPSLGPVFVVVQAPLPTGQLNAFLTFNQVAPGGSPGPSAGNVFYAYVLRPTGTPSQYTVVYASALLTVPTATNPSGEVATFPVNPGVQVQQGDVIAFYGEGVPVDTGTGTDVLSYPAPTAPVLSDTVTLGSTNFPIYPDQRTYSFAASVLDLSGGKVTLAGGIRKFVDTLPGLCDVSGPNNLGQCIPLAQKDTSVSFPLDGPNGSDFYRIGLVDYRQQMHSDLTDTTGASPVPLKTQLKGYVQLDTTNAAKGPPQYLGPMILATRNRPVRILFDNLMTSNLNVPVDTTYMGAGMVTDGTNNLTASEKRAVIHLHGGNTPWISDGTPHQWVTPAGGDGQPGALGFQKGFSFQNVPDMTSLVPNALGDGMGTLYYTNQQSGRLMFYHEHAYGTTRLGVYNGLAAGYLLVDPAQESALATAGAPGTIVTNPASGAITAADLAHVIPLVIQDKTFVPDIGQLAATDPTWDLTRGGWGDLWWPHVYMPNQNPADITGANGFGRWDYGPWFWPPQDPSTFVAGGQPYQCTSAAYPGGAGLAYPPLMCPGTPLPSGTPESFMDTPVVNGTAYPTLTVDPTAYRFQLLNAANDRSLNLGLYVAEPVTLSPVITAPGSNYTAPTVAIGGCSGVPAPTAVAQVGDGPIDPSTGKPTFTAGIIGVIITSQPSACAAPTITIADTAPGTGSGATVAVVMSQNTDVRMVPAIPVTAGRATPNCSKTLPMAGGGQVTALLDATSGNPVTKTGMPANCWPLYSSAQGYTAGPFGENGGQLSWGNSDARTGGVPDPTMAGPPIIQIGAEGGLMPKLAVIPSTAVSFDYNKRSITVLNVLNHGLWVGPAERADIIVDFSQFAGQTLIVYNDAPAPVPAGDPRLDYYTNDPDQSDSGGAPSTIAGYGPNMRTIMQIKVNPCSGTCPALNVGGIAAAIPQIFATTQDDVIVPESVYPAGHGNGPDTYIPIQATSVNAWVGGPVGSLTLTSGGAGYTAAPLVTIASPCAGTTCVAATATASLTPTSVASFTLTAGGSGYVTAPAVTVTGGGGSGATATTTLSTRSVASVTMTSGGNGYTSLPTVTFSAPPTGTTATGTAVVSNRKVVGVTITNPGSGYVTAPTVSFTGGGGGSAAGTVVLAPTSVASINWTAGGSGYTSSPTVAIAAPTGSGTKVTATATANLTPTVVSGVALTSGGSGYSSAPLVTIAPPQATGSTATAIANPPTVPLLPKTIQELFTLDYGRMNATLGVEVPFTNFLTQTTIPYGYVDPPTEIFKDGETQIWKITHNGVDTHFIHFHLFTVQVLNRVGWDGAIKPPDPYEVGLKDTVRMNPLEDIIVALRPLKQTLPWPVPNSYRPMDVTQKVGAANLNEFTNVDPTNQPAAVNNDVVNFGWEYVWHCHILGHEENDMMRPMVFAVAPAAPTVSAAPGAKKGTTVVTVTATATGDAPAANPPTTLTGAATGFTLYRSTLNTGPWTKVGDVGATVAGITATATYTDTGLKSKATYYYQAVSNNVVGYTKTYAAPAVGYPNVTATSTAGLPSGPVVAP